MLDVLIRDGTVVDGTGAPGGPPTSASATGASSPIGEIDEPADAHDRRRRQGRRARLRRHPHALRRAGVLGHDAVAVAAARRHDRDRRELRLHDRAARTRARRLPDAHAGARRGHAARPRSRKACRGTGRTFGEYLDRIDGTLAPNAGFLVGHSTIRRVVMGERGDEGRGHRRRARRDASAARRRASPRAALGFSSSLGAHAQRRRRRHGAVALRERGRDRRAVQRRVASTRARRSSSSRASAMFEDYAADLMTRMSLAANRPLNWNVLFVSARAARR